MDAEILNRYAVRWSGFRRVLLWACEQAGRPVLATLRLWVGRMRQRAELRATLQREPRFFRDIGVTRARVEREAAKWFWQA